MRSIFRFFYVKHVKRQSIEAQPWLTNPARGMSHQGMWRRSCRIQEWVVRSACISLSVWMCFAAVTLTKNILNEQSSQKYEANRKHSIEQKRTSRHFCRGLDWSSFWSDLMHCWIGSPIKQHRLCKLNPRHRRHLKLAQYHGYCWCPKSYLYNSSWYV